MTHSKYDLLACRIRERGDRERRGAGQRNDVGRNRALSNRDYKKGVWRLALANDVNDKLLALYGVCRQGKRISGGQRHRRRDR